MKVSLDRHHPQQDSSNSLERSDSEGDPGDSESGIDLSTRSLRNLKFGAQFAFPPLSKAAVRAIGNPSFIAPSPPTLRPSSMREALEGFERGPFGVEMTSTDDPFEEFEVDSGSEKEFLIANLKHDAPKNEIEQFRQAMGILPAGLLSIVQQRDTTMDKRKFEETMRTARVENGQASLSSLKHPKSQLILQKKVQDFAQSHMFMANKHVKPTTIQRRQFTRDTYDFARAIGMGKHQANIEVKRAKAAYRQDRGLEGALRLDESDDESALGLEINDTVEHIPSMTNGMQYGLVDPIRAWDKITNQKAKSLHSDPLTRKRKRDMVDTHPVNGAVMTATQMNAETTAKPLNNRERKRLRQLQSNGVKGRPADLVEGHLISKSRNERKAEKKRRRQNLRKSQANTNVTSEAQLPSNAIFKSTPTVQSDATHIGKASSENRYRKASSAQEEEPIQLKPTGETGSGNSPTDDQGFRTDAGPELRKRKRGKRKRRKLDNTTEISDRREIKAIAEAHDSNTNTNSDNPIPDLQDIDHLRDTDKRTLKQEKEGFKKDVANDNDGAETFSVLSELISTNSNRKMQGNHHRGVKNKTVTGAPQASTFSVIEAAKEDHSRQSDPLEATLGLLRDSYKADDVSEVFTTVSQILDSRCEVIIHTPSKTWWSHVRAQSDAKAESINFDSSTSVLESTFSEATRDHAFTMSERSLDWDHSGPEFDEIKVEPKATRSSPLKREVTTPTKAVKTRSSSTSLQTPQSNKKSRRVTAQTTPTPAERVPEPDESTATIKKNPAKPPVKSPFFSPPASTEKPKVPIPEKKPRQKGGIVSCIPFPPLSRPSFGLLQEKLWNDPFRLLVGVTFLNRTMGKHAIPVFFSLIEKYPTPADILAADKEDIICMTRHLGLQAQRAETYKKFAQFWIHDPPVKGKRYRVDHYPNSGNGMDIKAGEILDDNDPRSAWEIGHMTKGRYAIDSWRIFCRDVLRGEAEGWNGEGTADGFQPEWMRVQPRDKELVACLRWMWLKEGFSWDPVTGEKEVADRELMEAAIAGKIAWDDRGGMRIVEPDDEDNDAKDKDETD